ncbi:MAG: ankyrin repeat domain-containing protein [Pseudomonadota bacterium]
MPNPALISEDVDNPVIVRLRQEDTAALDQLLADGWDPNAKIEIGMMNVRPIDVALTENLKIAINYLLDFGVELSDSESPAILYAAPRCSTEVISRLIGMGADVNQTSRLGRTVVQSAIYYERFDLISFFLDNGFEVNRDEGRSFRSVVDSGRLELVELFVEQGVDLELFKPDMVYPYNSSPCHVAARHSLELVQYLVSQGANPSHNDLFGYRPFHTAKNNEIREFLRTLEPQAWHDTEEISKRLHQLSLPKDLIDFLSSSDRSLTVDHEYVKILEFSDLANVRFNNWKGREFVDLLAAVKVQSMQDRSVIEDFGTSAGIVVWFIEEQVIGQADYEHEEIREVGGWNAFRNNPAKLFN